MLKKFRKPDHAIFSFYIPVTLPVQKPFLSASPFYQLLYKCKATVTIMTEISSELF